MMYLAQADWITAFSQWQWWQIVGAGALIFIGIFFLRELSKFFFQRGEFVRGKAESNIAEMAMKANQDLTKQWADTVLINRETKDQLESLSEIIRQQHRQAENTTKAIEALVARIEAGNKGQEVLIDAVMATRLTIDENNKIMVGVSDNIEALIVKSDNHSKHLEDDTASTQRLITESAEKTIKATGERLTELDTVIRALPENFCKDIKEALSNDLTAIKDTVNSIIARLDAQKEASNETPFTPVVDLPVTVERQPDNGTGTDTDL